jgi:hypothetical protein
MEGERGHQTDDTTPDLTSHDHKIRFSERWETREAIQTPTQHFEVAAVAQRIQGARLDTQTKRLLYAQARRVGAEELDGSPAWCSIAAEHSDRITVSSSHMLVILCDERPTWLSLRAWSRHALFAHLAKVPGALLPPIFVVRQG